MTADFNKPIAEDQFLDVLTEIRDNLAALAKQDLSTANNVPDGAIQYSAENRRWEKQMGAVWQALSPLTQTLDVKVHDSERLGNQEPDHYLNADNINAGTLDVGRLDTEAADYTSANETKVARISVVRALHNWIRNQISTHKHTAQQITGILAQARIPNLPARKITSGVFAQSRIPNLPASRINSGVLDVARIPVLPESKIKISRRKNGLLIEYQAIDGPATQTVALLAGSTRALIVISGGGGGGGGGNNDGRSGVSGSSSSVNNRLGTQLLASAGGVGGRGFGRYAGRRGTSNPGAGGGTGGSDPAGVHEIGEVGAPGSEASMLVLASHFPLSIGLGSGGSGGSGALNTDGGNGASGYAKIWWYS